MEYYFYNATKKIRRNYFLSFNGVDDSRFIQDEKSTYGENGNKTLIETIYSTDKTLDLYKKSPHFAESKMLFGHTNMAFPRLFPAYNFEVMMVVREPLERTISNICQFSSQDQDGRVKFGHYYTDHDKCSLEYWDFIHQILVHEYPTGGLLVHENCYLRNCMSHIVTGNTYKNNSQDVDMDVVYRQLEKINISFYNDFNRGLQANFDKLNIPIDMSNNIVPNNSGKSKLGKYYGAPDKIIEWVTINNQYDVKLYQHLLATMVE